MSHARDQKSDSPPPSPGLQRIAHASTPPSIAPPSQPLAQPLAEVVALAGSTVSTAVPVRPTVPALPAIASTPKTPLLSGQAPSRLHVQDDSGLQPMAAPGGLSKSRHVAQYLDLAAAVSSAPYPIGAVPGAVRGAASGALWMASAVSSDRDNQQAVNARHARGESTGAMGWSNRVADASSFVAGASDAASSVFNYFGSSHGWAAAASTATAYTSNAFWGAAGAIGFGQGFANWRDAAKSKAASGLQMAGGVLNMVGAGFGMAAAQRQSADPDDSTAALYGYASAAAWTLGSFATIASNVLAKRAENTRFAQDVENRG